ncbi:hypothetical protein Swit_4451 [Rhizorhabdus wittichii RW1]|uniref:Uncharacterized protein n=1 Tax=Rhizorhabdus wittichii (strain DSM 6014 / CCUG 31198 / JCM 15750 / NBRC 105917 / EY 4224 / RW1) TaxID=392499 RepID=A0A9J9LFR6_RHIWR|nr:hypothetical protein Swit_4451 [Rhizorhabdus wittichii RW1]
MNYETTANPAGGDDTRPFGGAPSEAGAEAYDVDDGMTEPPGDGEGEAYDPFSGRDDDDDGSGDSDGDGDAGRGEAVDVEYEGQLYQVPRPLKEALLRQADYTRKTMELADQRRALAADKAGIEQTQAMTVDEFQAMARLQAVDAELQDLARHDWTQLDPRHPDAAGLRAAVGRLVQEQQALHGRLTEHHHHKAAREQQEIARTRADTDHAMAREIRDWSPERRQALENFAIALGIPDELLGHASAAEMRILNLAYAGAQQLERQRAANRGAYRPAAEIGAGAGSGPSDPSRMTMAQYRAWRAKQK